MKKKALVIEDNPINLNLVVELMKQMELEVFCATDADKGIALARELQPGLVLMDVQLPGMDGLTATKLLKQDPATQHIRIVALTAFAMKGDRERIMEAGCDAYIAKPIRYQEFFETIKSVLGEII